MTLFLLEKITKELSAVTKIDFSTVNTAQKSYSYDSLQEELATLNEKCATRKLKGVYYTPADIVEFILTNSIKFFYDGLETNRLNKSLPKNLSHEKFCFDCTFFDPTCGSGAFLLAVLELKLRLLDKNSDLNSDNVRRVVATVFGNDVNADSVLIAKLRLFLCVLKRCGAEYKIFKCDGAESANLSLLLLNSSLFWWYWVCVSDCRHITNKE